LVGFDDGAHLVGGGFSAFGWLQINQIFDPLAVENLVTTFALSSVWLAYVTLGV
jgi:hypothetical protein